MKHLRAIFLIGVSCFLYACGSQVISSPQKATAIHPSPANAHNNLGLAYQKLGKLDEAIVQHKRAIAIDPNHAQAHYNLARAYALKNEKTLSIEFLQKAITLDRIALEVVQTHSDFDNIRESPEFQQLINLAE